MIANLHTNDVINTKNDVDFDVEVVDYVRKNRFVRKCQLIDYTIELRKGERGHSRPSVERKITRLIKNGPLAIIKYPDLEKYGIYEEDGRAAYVTLKQTLKMKEDLDKTFSYLDSADPTTKKLVLEEISRNEKKYVLDPHQLDILVEHLDAEDNELANSLMDILFKYIDKKKIEPSNKDRFLEKLRSLLKHYKVSPDEYPMLRRHITWLLGYYRDSSVIDQLKEDAESLEDPSSVVCDYCDPLIAPFIEEHSLELFNFQMELKSDRKERASEFISQIKDEARNPKQRMEGF